MFRLIVFSFPLITIVWWILGHHLLRRVDHRWARPVRWLVGISAAVHLLGILMIVGGRMSGAGDFVPLPLLVSTYVWYIVLVPSVLIPWIVVAVLWLLTRFAMGKATPPAATPGAAPAAAESVDRLPGGPLLSRRQVLLLSAAALPPMVNLGATGKALASMDHFRVRQIDVPLADLPAELEGMTIAHVSDTHVGRFTNGAQLDAIARRTNGLGADLIAFTGDLINHSLDDLPEAVRFLRQLSAPAGVWICEGNHDLFESREGFDRGLREAGLNLLVNETAIVPVRNTQIEVMGLRWGGGATRRDAGIEANLRATLDRSPAVAEGAAAPLRILLAHHPHAFDNAVEAGIPLTLAGHTHGGQLMVAPGLGPGAMMFRYVTGLYRRAGKALVVSNGSGNWFPLRLNAPAEILLLRLVRAEA